jgi:hypothetical protein
MDGIGQFAIEDSRLLKLEADTILLPGKIRLHPQKLEAVEQYN